MTGSEISAENPGLTATSWCSPEFNPFWTVAGLQGMGCWELWSGSGSTLKWGCRKLELGRAKKQKGRAAFPPGLGLPYRRSWGRVEEVTFGVRNTVVQLYLSWDRWPDRQPDLLQRGPGEKEARRREQQGAGTPNTLTWAVNRQMVTTLFMLYCKYQMSALPKSVILQSKMK